MEVPRLMLAISGKFPPEAYTDARHQAPPAEGLAANLGRMPTLDIGADSIGQSAAINFFVAAENGMMGSNNLEAAQIIGISEHLKEMNTAWRAMVAWGEEPTADKLKTWFEGGATDVTGPADGSKRSERFATWYMGRIEAILGSSGFAVGNKLSLADVLLFNMFADNLSEGTAPADMPQWKKEVFGSKAATDAVLEKHPKIKASIAAVAGHPNTQRWMASRGVQYF